MAHHQLLPIRVALKLHHNSGIKSIVDLYRKEKRQSWIPTVAQDSDDPHTSNRASVVGRELNWWHYSWNWVEVKLVRLKNGLLLWIVAGLCIWRYIVGHSCVCVCVCVCMGDKELFKILFSLLFKRGKKYKREKERKKERCLIYIYMFIWGSQQHWPKQWGPSAACKDWWMREETAIQKMMLNLHIQLHQYLPQSSQISQYSTVQSRRYHPSLLCGYFFLDISHVHWKFRRLSGILSDSLTLWERSTSFFECLKGLFLLLLLPIYWILLTSSVRFFVISKICYFWGGFNLIFRDNFISLRLIDFLSSRFLSGYPRLFKTRSDSEKQDKDIFGFLGNAFPDSSAQFQILYDPHEIWQHHPKISMDCFRLFSGLLGKSITCCI